jgi:hypothetical protein
VRANLLALAAYRVAAEISNDNRAGSKLTQNIRKVGVA